MSLRHLHSCAELAASAEAFRQKYAPGVLGAFPIEEVVEFELRITIVPAPGICSRMRRMAWLANDGKHIFVDAAIVEGQAEVYREVLAHETAHLEHHHDILPPTPFCSDDECRSYQEGLTDSLRAAAEWEAKIWAGYLLVPSKDLRQVLRTEVAAMTEVMGAELGASLDTDPVTREFFKSQATEAVARRFEVPVSLAEARIRHDRLWREISIGQQHHSGRASAGREMRLGV